MDENGSIVLLLALLAAGTVICIDRLISGHWFWQRLGGIQHTIVAPPKKKESTSENESFYFGERKAR